MTQKQQKRVIARRAQPDEAIHAAAGSENQQPCHFFVIANETSRSREGKARGGKQSSAAGAN